MTQINPTSFTEACITEGVEGSILLRVYLVAILHDDLCFMTTRGGQYYYLHFASREMEPQGG